MSTDAKNLKQSAKVTCISNHNKLSMLTMSEKAELRREAKEKVKLEQATRAEGHKGYLLLKKEKMAKKCKNMSGR